VKKKTRYYEKTPTNVNLQASDPDPGQGKRASTQSVALDEGGCPLRWRIILQLRRRATIHPPSLHTLPSIGAGFTYSGIATRDGLMVPGPMAAPFLHSLHAIASNHGTPFVSSSPSRNRGICGYRST